MMKEALRRVWRSPQVRRAVVGLAAAVIAAALGGGRLTVKAGRHHGKR